jgi:pimeloyl-ACP methyl ester carboxylesterase
VDVVLLHGAWCGSWCWEAVVHVLAERGLTAAAPELPIGDRDAQLHDYLDAAAACCTGPDPPVVVGHSLAGILLEPLAAIRPVRRLVYLAAFVPRPGVSMRQQWRAERDLLVRGWNRGVASDADEVSWWVDLDAAADVLFHDLPPPARSAAAGRLRPQAWGVSDAPFEGCHRSPRSYVMSADDHLIDSGWQRRTASSVLGVDPLVLAAGHSPMLSRPEAVADAIAPNETPPPSAAVAR